VAQDHGVEEGMRRIRRALSRPPPEEERTPPPPSPAPEGGSVSSPFERLTPRAQKVVILAKTEANVLPRGYIGTEHLLLALLREAHGLGAVALANLGVRIEQVQEVLQAAGSGQAPAEPPTRLLFSQRVKRTIELALGEAQRMGQEYVGTEHLLLGLLAEGEGGGASVLASLGVTLAGARAEIERLLTSPPPVGMPPQLLPSGGPVPSPQLIEVVRRAQALAAEAGVPEIGVEHLKQALAEHRGEGR